MRLLYPTIITMILLFSSGHSAWAKPLADTPWYDIELIIFAQNGGNSSSSEVWPTNPGQPDTLETEEYALVPVEEWQLEKELNSLKRTGGRQQPLLHTVWRQPVVSQKMAKPIAVNVSSEDGIQLTGTVKISVQRYLHVNLDLLLGDPNTPSVDTLQASNEPTYTALPAQYRFIAHRKMRSDELHYIDHPKLGVIIKVTKYTPPEAIPEVVPAEEIPPAAAPGTAKTLAPN